MRVERVVEFSGVAGRVFAGRRFGSVFGAHTRYADSSRWSGHSVRLVAPPYTIHTRTYSYTDITLLVLYSTSTSTLMY